MRMLQHFRPLARSGLLIKDSAARHGPALLHTADGPASGSNAKKITIEPMANRELVRVRGDEVVTFLQGLITNDMNLLQSGQQPSIWTFFLNKAGRVLYDNIIFRTDQPSTYFIECDKAVTNDLCKLLRMYRVRRKIDIDSVEAEYRPWLAFSTNIAESIPMEQKIGENFFAAPDPRLKELGNRLIVPANKSFDDVAKSLSSYGEFTLNTDAHNYRNLRYRNGIAEGVEEIPPGKSFPLELNGDFLQGVSFNKGCYIGQELTARVAHTGVVRKRLMPLRLSAPIQGTDSKIQTKEGAAVGTIRGVDNDLALAVLRIEPAFSGVPLVVEGQPCYPEKPKWWPEILPERGTIVN